MYLYRSLFIVISLNILILQLQSVELNLSPHAPDAILYEGEGGVYYAWTPVKSPVLFTAEVSAGKLVLQPRGFAMPHYSDVYKIGYVVQGTCTVGLISPNNPEKIILIKEGYAIPVPIGSLSWWFNGGDSYFTIVFLGESKQSYNPGNIDYFPLVGSLGILGGFSGQFISKIYHLSEVDSKKLTRSQIHAFLLKVDVGINMPSQSNCDVDDYIFDLAGLISSNNANKLGGSDGYVACAEMTADNFPLLDEIGLSANLVRLGPNSMFDPSYSTDGTYRIVFVIKGSGRVQIVGLTGIPALDAYVRQDQLFVVPKLYAAALLANEHGLEFVLVTTSSRPVLAQLAGNTSIWKALSSPVLQAALNVSPEFVELFKSKNEDNNNSI